MIRAWTKERPFLTAVLAGVVASVLYAVVSWPLKADFWSNQVPAWLLAIALIVLLGTSTALVLHLRARRSRVFIAVSAFRKKQFFADLLHYTLLESSRGFDVTVKIPAQDYSAAHQRAHFRELLAHKADYLGGILVPIEPHTRRQAIRDFATKFRRPIVFLNLAPFEAEEDYPSNTAFVGFDNTVGGRLGAQALAQQCRNRGVTTPNFLVIASNIQTGRQAAFDDHIKSIFPSANVRVDEDGRFLRENAKRIATDYLGEALRCGELFDGVFCTNDEMALGVVEALNSFETDLRKRLFIVGFDGIQEALLAIDKRGSPLINTVLQNTEKLAGEAVDLLRRMLQGERVQTVTLLAPTLYKRG